MDIDTSKCGFEEQPMYFTELIGSSHMVRMMGASSIYSPTESGFRIYLNEEVLHTTPTGSRANSWRYHIKWCGVGKATGPTVANVCCGTGPASWGSSRYEGSQNIDAKTCEMKGDPVWITAAEGAINSGPDQFIGTNAGYSQGYRYSHMYIRKAFDNSNYWGWVGTASMFNKGQVNMLKPKFCLFGEPFPTGDMRINSELIEPDEYPCNGVRVIDDGKIVSNSAKICCGKSDTTWKQKGKFNIYKEIDTSECSFLEDDSNQVVYMTSLGGKDKHQFVSGTTSYMTSSPTGFSMSLSSHKGENAAWYAKELGWYVNWCGIGKAGKPKPPPPPPVPPPPPNAPPPPPVTKLSEPPASASLMSGTKSLINDKCASYRDNRNHWHWTKQEAYYAKCMAADCVQSLESSNNPKNPWENPGCRFRDALGFCYCWGTAQKWCSENPTNSFCNDGGEKFGAAPLGTAPAGQTEWTPHTGVYILHKGEKTEKTFDCQCMKNCGCTKTACWCVDPATAPSSEKGATAQYTKQIKKGIHTKSAKKGECSCHCGTKIS